MFTNSIRMANIFMVMAALALCVSACTQSKMDYSAYRGTSTAEATALEP